MIKLGFRARAIRKLVIPFFAITILFTCISPILWLFISSIVPPSELTTKPLPLIPKRFSLKNYIYIFTSSFGQTTILHTMVNSTIISLSVVALSVLIAALAAYAIIRIEFVGRRLVLPSILFASQIPRITLLIPLYEIFMNMHLTDTIVGLVLIYTARISPFVTWIMHGFFEKLPWELEDAALADGCTRFQALTRIILPIAKPGLFAVILLSYIFSWNEFLYALVFTHTYKARTISVSILEFAVVRHMYLWDLLCAGAFMAIVPPVLIAIFFNKYLVKGLVVGAVKG